jgi:hypothetical protein
MMVTSLKILATAFFVVVVGGVAVVLLTRWAIGTKQPSLADRANVSCGRDRLVSALYHPSGFARRESIEVHCQRPGGILYIVIVK